MPSSGRVTHAAGSRMLLIDIWEIENLKTQQSRLWTAAMLRLKQPERGHHFFFEVCQPDSAGMSPTTIYCLSKRDKGSSILYIIARMALPRV